ncbi:hypothetical protein [Novipirellula rosea]|uniref:Uncharacterized protein n=1 Tax=Novipirellula rosea TaxID=1031540 RepID=A0ABP8N3U1_9BACT|tara:strand:- start:1472 stop:1765 length:294 start_codon:yes stop_codon:yes gene_type:complete
MKPLRIAALICTSLLFASAGEVQAEGLFSRLRSANQRSSMSTQGWFSPSNSRSMMGSYPTRNLNSRATRLPSGRSYYQGRYYGNFNNRFYGPQYGYF